MYKLSDKYFLIPVNKLTHDQRSMFMSQELEHVPSMKKYLVLNCYNETLNKEDYETQEEYEDILKRLISFQDYENRKKHIQESLEKKINKLETYFVLDKKKNCYGHVSLLDYQDGKAIYYSFDRILILSLILNYLKISYEGTPLYFTVHPENENFIHVLFLNEFKIHEIVEAKRDRSRFYLFKY